MGSLLRFQYTAIGDSRDEVVEELERYERIILTESGGEPWVTVTDDVEKMGLSERHILDPGAWVYKGQRELIFAGPTRLGEPPDVGFRDGFRPQSTDDIEGS